MSIPALRQRCHRWRPNPSARGWSPRREQVAQSLAQPIAQQAVSLAAVARGDECVGLHLFETVGRRSRAAGFQLFVIMQIMQSDRPRELG